MWAVNGTMLQMAEEDFGLALPVEIQGTELTEHDSIRITFKTEKNGETILVKDYSDISANTVHLELTEEESALFPVGSYVYSLDWYQDGVFMCNIIPTAAFGVVDKA